MFPSYTSMFILHVSSYCLSHIQYVPEVKANFGPRWMSFKLTFIANQIKSWLKNDQLNTQIC